MEKIKLPKGVLNILPKGRGGCEFREKINTGHNLQGVRVCDDHKDMMLILRCPVCSLDLAIHVGGFHGQRFWCVVHGAFWGRELRKDSKFDKDGNIKIYWSEGFVKAQRRHAEELNDKYYGKIAKDIQDYCND